MLIEKIKKFMNPNLVLWNEGHHDRDNPKRLNNENCSYALSVMSTLSIVCTTGSADSLYM
jgi:hypothetical protein